MTPDPRRTATARSILLAAALIGGLAACGSGSDSNGADSGAATATAPADASAGDEGDAPVEVPSDAGPGSGTLTMDDGTVYALELSTCETSNTDDTFVLPDSYELSGTVADGAYEFSLSRLGLSEDFITTGGALAGDFFDEDGVNIGLLYTADMGTSDLVVDGGSVSGTFRMNAFGTNLLHGENPEATVDVRC